MEIIDVQNKIGRDLKDKNWSQVKFSVKLPECSGRYDVFAESGGLRKKRLLINIATDPSDASLASMLLQGCHYKAEKFIYLMSGDKAFVSAEKGIKIISSVSELPNV